PRSPGPARRAAGHRAVLPPPRRDRRLEPALRVGRLRAVPTGAARPLRGRAPGRARTRRRTRTSLVPVGAQAARRRGPGPALLPAAGLDPGDGPAGRARPRAAAARARRARPLRGWAALPGQGRPYVGAHVRRRLPPSGRLPSGARPCRPRPGLLLRPGPPARAVSRRRSAPTAHRGGPP